MPIYTMSISQLYFPYIDYTCVNENCYIKWLYSMLESGLPCIAGYFIRMPLHYRWHIFNIWRLKYWKLLTHIKYWSWKIGTFATPEAFENWLGLVNNCFDVAHQTREIYQVLSYSVELNLLGSFEFHWGRHCLVNIVLFQIKDCKHLNWP